MGQTIQRSSSFLKIRWGSFRLCRLGTFLNRFKLTYEFLGLLNDVKTIWYWWKCFPKHVLGSQNWIWGLVAPELRIYGVLLFFIFQPLKSKSEKEGGKRSEVEKSYVSLDTSMILHFQWYPFPSDSAIWHARLDSWDYSKLKCGFHTFGLENFRISVRLTKT